MYKKIFSFLIAFIFIQIVIFFEGQEQLLSGYSFNTIVVIAITSFVLAILAMLPTFSLSRIAKIGLIAAVLLYGITIVGVWSLLIVTVLATFIGVSSIGLLYINKLFNFSDDLAYKNKVFVCSCVAFVLLFINIHDNSSFYYNKQKVFLPLSVIDSVIKEVETKHPEILFRQGEYEQQSLFDYERVLETFVSEVCKDTFISFVKENKCTFKTARLIETELSLKRKEIIYKKAESTGTASACLELPSFEEEDCIKRYARTLADCKLLPLVSENILGDSRTSCIRSTAYRLNDKNICNELSDKKISGRLSNKAFCLKAFEN